MTTLTSELKSYGLTEEQIKRINATLNRGKTVRQTYTRKIDSIYLNDESMVTLVIIDANGNEKDVEREWQ